MPFYTFDLTAIKFRLQTRIYEYKDSKTNKQNVKGEEK